MGILVRKDTRLLALGQLPQTFVISCQVCGWSPETAPVTQPAVASRWQLRGLWRRVGNRAHGVRTLRHQARVSGVSHQLCVEPLLDGI